MTDVRAQVCDHPGPVVSFFRSAIPADLRLAAFQPCNKVSAVYFSRFDRQAAFRFQTAPPLRHTPLSGGNYVAVRGTGPHVALKDRIAQMMQG